MDLNGLLRKDLSSFLPSLQKITVVFDENIKPLAELIDKEFQEEALDLLSEDPVKKDYLEELSLMKEFLDLFDAMSKVIKSFVSFIGQQVASENDLAKTRSFIMHADEIAQMFFELSKNFTYQTPGALVRLVESQARKLLGKNESKSDSLSSRPELEYDFLPEVSLENKLEEYPKLEKQIIEFSTHRQGDSLQDQFLKMIHTFLSFDTILEQQGIKKSNINRFTPKDGVYYEFTKAAEFLASKLAETWLDLNLKFIELNSCSKSRFEIPDFIQWLNKFTDKHLPLDYDREGFFNAGNLLLDLRDRNQNLSTVDLQEYNWDLNDPESRRYILSQMS